jgi:hypothetical protein
MKTFHTLSVFLFFLLPISAMASGQARTNGSAAASSSASGSTQPQKQTAVSSGLLYPPVSADYVGGTIPGMPLHKWRSFPFGTMHLGVYQFRTSGKLALGPRNIYFLFRAGSVSPIEGRIQVHRCAKLPGNATPSAIYLCHRFDPPSAETPNRKQWYLMQVAYKGINGLSRGRKPSGSQASAQGNYITAATAMLTALLGTTTKSNVQLKYAGGMLAAGVLGYYFLVTKPGLSENYLAIFSGRKVKGCDPTKKADVKNMQNCAQIAFVPGRLAMFRIPNSHNYFNISMILTAETGLEFVSQTAEIGAASGGG